MTAHDPLCPMPAAIEAGAMAFCQCALIARVRADEARKSDKLAIMCGQLLADRERLRAQVEALPERGIGDVIRKADVLALLGGAP